MGRNDDSSRAAVRRGRGRLARASAGAGKRVCPSSGVLRKPCAQKKPGLLTPEQQRQEENGDAAASPTTYRKDRPRIFGRVRNFFALSRDFLRPPAFAHMRLLRLAGYRRQHAATGRQARPAAPLLLPLSGCALIAWRVEPWRADRFPRDGWQPGRLRCCCQQPAGSGPCLVPTGVAARRRVAPGSPSRFPRG